MDSYVKFRLSLTPFGVFDTRYDDVPYKPPVILHGGCLNSISEKAASLLIKIATYKGINTYTVRYADVKC